MAAQEDQIVTLNMQEDFAGKLAAGRPVQAIIVARVKGHPH
jgi:hypothetical protein